MTALKREDYVTAFREFTPLAEQGNAFAQGILGAMYDTGKGVPQDYKEALRWYRLAADQGLSVAQFNLGGMYRDGKGVPQDFKEAARLSRPAADQGLPRAQGILGFFYALGKGVPQDYVQAHMWFNLSAAGGDKEAAEARDSLATKMTSSQIKEAERLAREWKPKK
jgi:TPR repeat protein